MHRHEDARAWQAGQYRARMCTARPAQTHVRVTECARNPDRRHVDGVGICCSRKRVLPSNYSVNADFSETVGTTFR